MPQQPFSTANPVVGEYRPHDTRDNHLVYYGYPSVTERLLEYCSMDVVFVAIDFENTRMLGGYPDEPNMSKTRKIQGLFGAQAGISILDTRDLKKSPEIAVTVRQLCVGGYWYCETVPWRLLFGTSERHTLQSLYTTLTTLLRFEDPITKKLRPIVIIGHDLRPNGCKGDTDCLFKLTDPNIRSPIIDYLDTSQGRVVREQLAFNSGTSEFRSPSLMRILEHLSIPFANLHVAANDAMFTLRAMLLMAVQDCHSRAHNLTSAERKILAELEGIALVPLSLPPGMKMRKIAFPNNRGLTRKARGNCTAVNRKARREVLQNQKKMDSQRKTRRNDDWADMCQFTPLWDLENEQISTDDDDPNQTPITTDDESLDLSNLFNDESSDDSDTREVLISNGFVDD